MKKVLFGLVVLFFLVSCRTKKIQETKESTLETNVEKLVTYKDTTFFAPASFTELNLSVSDLFKKDLKNVSTPKVYTQKNGNATVKVAVKDNKITATAYCDSLALKAKIRKELLKELVLKTTSDNKSVKIATPWTYFLVTFFIGLAVGLVVSLIIKLKF